MVVDPWRMKVSLKFDLSWGGLSLVDELATAPWVFSYRTLTLTLTQKLKRHTFAPRGSLIHNEDAREGATVAPGCRRRLRVGAVVVPCELGITDQRACACMNLLNYS